MPPAATITRVAPPPARPLVVKKTSRTLGTTPIAPTTGATCELFRRLGDPRGVLDWRLHDGAWWARCAPGLSSWLYGEKVPGLVSSKGSWWRIPNDITYVVRGAAAPPWRGKIRWKRDPAPYQTRIIPWAQMLRGVLIGDAMRLRKTATSLACAYVDTRARADERADGGPLPCTVAVVQAAKLWDWADECNALIPDPYGRAVEILQAPSRRGKRAAPISKRAWLYIVNYEVLHRWFAFLDGLNIGCSIADESVYIKTRGSQRHKSMVILGDAVREHGGLNLALSGEPVENRPWDLWGQLRYLRGPHDFGSLWQYHQRYCGGAMLRQSEVDPNYDPAEHGEGWQGYDQNGLSNEEELAARLSGIMVRRRKDSPEVAASLPQVGWHSLRIEGAVRAIPRAVATITADGVRGGAKVLIFTYYKDTARLCVDECARILKERGASGIDIQTLTGDVSAAARDKILRGTREVPVGTPCVAVATIDAMGMGSNFAHFDVLVVAELHYVPAKVLQTVERPYDIDRTRPYDVYFVSVRGSEDDHVAQLVVDKMRQIVAVVGATRESSAVIDALGISKQTPDGRTMMDDLRARLHAIGTEDTRD